MPEWLKRTKYGFVWSGIAVTRRSSVDLSNGKYHILEIDYPHDGPKHRLEVYVSPTGQMRVYRDSKELTECQ